TISKRDWSSDVCSSDLAIFIMLSASLEVHTLLEIFNPHIIGYVLLMMFAVRPLSIFISTIRSGLEFKEKALIGWIAPRGIVALRSEERRVGRECRARLL